MKINDLDFNILLELVSSVPQDLEINSIMLDDGYKLNLTKTYKENREEEYRNSLDNLLEMIDNLKKSEIIRNSEQKAIMPENERNLLTKKSLISQN